MASRSHPLLYEVNTRCWVREICERSGRPISLSQAVEAACPEWRRLGVTHVWLMGVWEGGPLARRVALSDPALRRACAEALPDLQEEDIGPSPYAIGNYRVAASLGGEAGLTTCRDVLHRHDLRLVLDFVPNHLGLDHPWVRDRPELFVQAPASAPEAFRVGTANGSRWLAHGKDPNFSAWADTVQLDYRLAETHRAMEEALLSVAERCDGVRCDMAMLALHEVFASTWKAYPPTEETTAREFWTGAIAATRRAHPDFLFLAEAYWGLEGRLQDLGFDYVYDKGLYDRLVGCDAYGTQRHLLELPPERLSRGTHFLENHDEPRIATRLSFDQHKAAALVILGLPGMRFLHDGQLAGNRLRCPVQLLRRAREAEQAEIARFYLQVLEALQETSVGRGRGELLVPTAAWDGNPTGKNFIIIQWQESGFAFDLVAVNLASHAGQCRVKLTVPGLAGRSWVKSDRLDGTQGTLRGQELDRDGLGLDLPASAVRLWHFEPGN